MHPTAVCTSWAWRRSTLDQHGSVVPALLSADLPSRVVYAAAAKVLTSHRAPPTTCTRVRTICSSSLWSRSRIEYGWHACTLPRTRQSGRSNPSSGQYSFWPFGQTPNNNMVQQTYVGEAVAWGVELWKPVVLVIVIYMYAHIALISSISRYLHRLKNIYI
jgi:hypothetical protein